MGSFEKKNTEGGWDYKKTGSNVVVKYSYVF